jgi:hypothetical protein
MQTNPTDDPSQTAQNPSKRLLVGTAEPYKVYSLHMGDNSCHTRKYKHTLTDQNTTDVTTTEPPQCENANAESQTAEMYNQHKMQQSLK